jgi:hypothetical protein
MKKLKIVAFVLVTLFVTQPVFAAGTGGKMVPPMFASVVA